MDPNQMIGWELSGDQSFILPKNQKLLFTGRDFFLLMTSTNNRWKVTFLLDLHI